MSEVADVRQLTSGEEDEAGLTPRSGGLCRSPYAHLALAQYVPFLVGCAVTHVSYRAVHFTGAVTDEMVDAV